MACRDWNEDYDTGPDFEEIIKQRDLLKIKVDNLTDLLCTTCKLFLDKENLPYKVYKWYEEHSKLDGI